MTLRKDSAAVTARKVNRFNRLAETICEQTNVCFIDNRNILAHHLNRSNLHLNSSGSKVLGSSLCRYLRRANFASLWPRIDNKTGNGFSAGLFPSTKTFEPYHDVDQLLAPSRRNDKSLNQVNYLNKNCSLKRHSDINNSATNSHIELDNYSQVYPKTPRDLPNRISNSAHAQPNLGIPVTRGFKIASINLASLYKNIDQLRIYMLSKTVDILAINETRLDSSIQNGEVSIPGYTLERKDRNRNGGGVALYIRDSINYKSH